VESRVPARARATLNTNFPSRHISNKPQHFREATTSSDNFFRKVGAVITDSNLLLRYAHAVDTGEADLATSVSADIVLADLVRAFLVGAKRRARNIMERRREGKEPECRVKSGQTEEWAEDECSSGTELASGPSVGPVEHSP
jgi:hypothetical protein